jgi:cobalt-precorrin-6B (C15)-methyltransferase
MWNYKTPGVPDGLFTQSDGVLGPTKEEIRVLTISKARLREDSVVVDVGCGTGGLTVEAALQVSKGKVYAFDEDPEAVRLTGENVAKFCLKNVEITLGKTPEILENLPSVDAVIIGGSHSLKETIQTAHKKLRSGGRIVINAILLETATAAIQEVCGAGFVEVDVVEGFVAKGRPVTAGTMMVARNPITIVSASKV